MKRRIITAGLLVYLVAFLQMSVFAVFRPFGVSAILPIAFVIATSLLRRRYESVCMGFIYGLTYDMLLGRSLGFHAILYSVVAALISMVNEKIYRDKIAVQLVFSVTAAFVTEFFYYLVLFLLKGYETIGVVVGSTLMPVALLSGILVIPIYPPLAKLYYKMDMLDRMHNRIGNR